jgi:ATP-dependent RNA helicase RhlB
MNFSELDVPYEVKQGIEHAGFTICTPVQEAVIPRALRGEDVQHRHRRAQSKTAAFHLLFPDDYPAVTSGTLRRR